MVGHGSSRKGERAYHQLAIDKAKAKLSIPLFRWGSFRRLLANKVRVLSGIKEMAVKKYQVSSVEPLG